MCTNSGLADGTGPKLFVGSKKPCWLRASKNCSGSLRLAKSSKPCCANSSPRRIVSKNDSNFDGKLGLKEALHLHLDLQPQRRRRGYHCCKGLKNFGQLRPVAQVSPKRHHLDVALGVILGKASHQFI